MIVLDASVLIAHLEAGDVHHGRAKALLLDNCGDDFASSAITIAEVLVGAMRAGRGEPARVALASLGVRILGLDADAPAELAELRVRTGLKLPDCCVLQAARQSSARLATFDTRLALAAGQLGTQVLPP